jgi:hypothetical protein
MVEMCSYGAGKYALRGESLDHTVGAAMSPRELDVSFGLVVAARGPPRADCGEISDLFWRLT